MDKQTKHLLELYGQKRFSQIENIPTNKMLKIDSEKVTQLIKKNHSILICTCESSGKTGHNSFCRHKQFFIMFPLLESLNQKLNKLIEDYESYTNIKGKFDPYVFLNDLKNLKRTLLK